MKIAVDAMGGDYGPAVVVEGAVTAAREFGVTVVLVGDRPAIEREVSRLGSDPAAVEIERMQLGKSDSLKIDMRPGGGFIARF